MRGSLSKVVLAVAGLFPAAGMAGCVAHVYPAHGEVVVREAPPAERVEVVGVAPSPEHVWIKGHYAVEGGRWVWVGGRWERRPRHEAVWIPGHHERTDHGYVWVEGRWR